MGPTSIVLLLCLSRVLSDESRALLAPETDSPEFWTLADMWRDRSRFSVFSPRYEAKVAPKPGMDTMPEFLRQMGTARDARDRAEALAAVREGRGRIFFKHMRKAGGTTVIRYFEHVVAFKSYVPLPEGQGSNETQPREVRRQAMNFTAQEWGVFPVTCFLREARTLFVTCLRDPIRRQISEYWYAGSGYKGVIDCGRNASRCAERGAENNVMGDASWHAWMDKTTENSAYNPRTLERGHYFPEYYTRALTGNCEPEDEKKRKRDPKIPERFRSCGFGGVFQARIPAARARVIREHFF